MYFFEKMCDLMLLFSCYFLSQNNFTSLAQDVLETSEEPRKHSELSAAQWLAVQQLGKSQNGGDFKIKRLCKNCLFTVILGGFG